jgi:integrase
MPRPRKPARLYARPDTGEWVIRDGGKDTRTGYRGAGSRTAAENALAHYLASRIEVPDTPQAPDDVGVSVVLARYLQNLREDMAAPERQAYAVKALSIFWRAKTCGQVTERTCRDYAKSRPSLSTARRELSVLRAALNKAHRDRILVGAPAVWLPPTGKPRPDWLTREEFARLLWALWRNKKSQHAARLALCQFYTGSRPRTVARTTWVKRSDGPWVDLLNGIWWRSGDGEADTVKACRAHSIPPRLAAHLRRWRRLYGGTYIVEFSRYPGRPVLDIGKARDGAAQRAGVKRITPHTIKHTAITLAIQGGMSAEDAADYFSTSIETIQSNYWHHSPHDQARAVAMVGNLGRTPRRARTEMTTSAQK